MGFLSEVSSDIGPEKRVTRAQWEQGTDLIMSSRGKNRGSMYGIEDINSPRYQYPGVWYIFLTTDLSAESICQTFTILHILPICLLILRLFRLLHMKQCCFRNKLFSASYWEPQVTSLLLFFFMNYFQRS